MVDENGTTIILKNNKPRYVIIEYSQLEQEEIIDNAEVDEIVKRVLAEHVDAFRKLAK